MLSPVCWSAKTSPVLIEATTLACPNGRCSSWPPSSSSTPKRTCCCWVHPAPARVTWPRPWRSWPSAAAIKVLYREAHQLIEDLREARELGELRQYRAQLKAADLLLIDDLFLRKLPAQAGEELADVLMSRYEKGATMLTSNRPVEDWATLLGDVVVVTPLLDRLMHHGHLLKFEGKSWRLKEAAARVAKRGSTH